VADALCLFGHSQGRHHINPGLRSLAEAAGVDHSTVGHVLHLLEAEGLIERVGHAHGIDADIWRLSIELGAGCRPARGRRVGLHRLFRVLGGHLVGEVYQALREGAGQLTTADLVSQLGYSRSAVYEALDMLRAYHLATATRQGWESGPADPDSLSKALGGEEQWKIQHDQHGKDRVNWRNRVIQRRHPRPTPDERWAIFQTEMAAVEPPDPRYPVPFTGRAHHTGLRQQPSPHDQAVTLLLGEFGGRLLRF
jgi:hypothetical protein